MCPAQLTAFSLIASAAALTASSAFAEIKTQKFDYEQGGTVLQGFVAWDDATKEKRRHPTDANAFVAEATAAPKLVKTRFDAALAQLEKRPEVNPKQIGAVGYCYGGEVRAGAPLPFVVTFHVALGTKTPAKNGFKPRVLVLTGGADPMVPKEQVDAFQGEMTAAAKADLAPAASPKSETARP